MVLLSRYNIDHIIILCSLAAGQRMCVREVLVVCYSWKIATVSSPSYPGDLVMMQYKLYNDLKSRTLLSRTSLSRTALSFIPRFQG